MPTDTTKVKRLFCEFIREIAEPVFDHEEQTFMLQIRESDFENFEDSIPEPEHFEIKEKDHD